MATSGVTTLRFTLIRTIFLPADTLVLESTYGDRLHDPTPLIDQIRGLFREAIARRGTILIPAFAVARAQLVTLLLGQLMESGELPRIPIHVDSPMAVDVTDTYARYLGTGQLDPGNPSYRGRLLPRRRDLSPDSW